MHRPKPKAEIIIAQDREFLSFSLASEDAADWLDREAPPFMSTYARAPDSLTAIAYVRPNFNPVDVAAYLRSYNDQ